MEASRFASDAEAAGADWVGCMRANDFEGAWRISDRVLAARDPAAQDDPSLPYHRRWVWDGTKPDGLRVLVRCYHGLGDTLQFVRLLPALRARAAHVTLEAQPALCPLLARIPGVDRLVPFDVAAPHPSDACTVEIMELGHMLRIEAADAAACVPYLTAEEADPKELPDRQGTIGLCWQAGGWDETRSLKLADLLAACDAPGRRFVSLQRGPAAAEATSPAFAIPCDDDSDMVRTARLAAAACCVVSVDTAVAHLAGGLGRPLVVLLKADADWRWPRAGLRSAWYPTATILRQQRQGDWSMPLRQLPALCRRLSLRSNPQAVGYDQP